MIARQTERRARFALAGGLTTEELDRMHQGALELIEEVGLELPHDGILKRLAEHDGVHIEDRRVRFDGAMADRLIRSLSYRRDAADFGHPYTRMSGAYEMNVRDLESGVARPATYADLVDLIKLQDSYDMRGSSPVRPLDVPGAALQEVAMYRACYKHSRWIGQSIFEANPKSTRATADIVYEMAQAAGKPYTVGCWVISPFRISWDDLDVVYHYLDKGVPMWVATMPIAAATAPIHLVSAYIQSLAELFAGYVMLRLLQGETYCYCSMIDSIRAYPFDMKYGSFVYGSPEDIHCTLLQIQLNNYYGIPIIAKSLLTAGKEPDAQAAAEKAAHTIVAASMGVDGFTNIGLLSVDEIYSAEQVAIDNEIVDYVTAFMRGIDTSEEAFDLTPIKEVGIGGTFLDHDSTLAHYRSAFWMPSLFEHDMLNHWQQIGSPTLQAKARAIARRRIAEHEDPLPLETQREVDRIYERAAKTLS